MMNQKQPDTDMLISLLDGMSTFAVILDLEGVLLFANQAPLVATDFALEEVIGKKFWDCVWWNFNPEIQSVIKQDCHQAVRGQQINREIQFFTPKGLRWIAFNIQPVLDDDGSPLYLVAEARSIEKRRQAERALLESEQKYRTLFEESADAILLLDKDRFVDCNMATVKMLGYEDKSELLNTHPSELSPEKQEDGRYSFEKANEMIAIAKRRGSHRFEWTHCRKNKQPFPVEVLLTPVNYGDKNFIYVVWRDISERKREREMLQLMAHYDVLTQLPNRTLLADRFSQAVAHSKRSNTMLAVCFLDLDNFKPVNDNYGHKMGDQLLIEVAKRIKASIREEDTASRQGGDEFILLLRDVESREQCKETLDRVREALAQPYLVNGDSHQLTTSIGVALYPHDSKDLDTLIRQADQAMYQVKLTGRNRYQLFDSSRNIQATESLIRRKEVEQALNDKQFKLFYQPKVNMKTGKVFGAEALIRWIHPEKGLIPPLDFLPLIECTDLEIVIGGWVINEALSQIDSWRQQGVDLEVSINISSHHLQSTVFFDQLNEALDKHPSVDSRKLQLEILESTVLGDIQIIRGIVKSCQDVLGVKVALDDFGTGYSSLTHLRNIPASTIKIDQTFVRNMLEDRDDLALVEGIISLAKTFDREVIAEGVESAEHGILLMRIGCDCAQGYGISRPLSADEMISWLHVYQPDQTWSVWAGSEWEMSNLPLVLAQSDHLKWVEEILNVLDGKKQGLDAAALCNHSECRFGQWYYDHGQKHYGHLQSFRELDAIHLNIHKLGRQIIQLYNMGKKEEAALLVDDFLVLKSKVLETLNALQQQVIFSSSRP